jgi:5-methyltetrahydrofolate--homocysteine methyltransferase
MQHVAAEMQRDDWFRSRRIPLLIGGATTSRVHTAVKIAPHYEGPVVYVPDASRSVGVCADLLSAERAPAYVAELNADYDHVRRLHAGKTQTPLVSLAAARANRTPVDWSAYSPLPPRVIGRRQFVNQDLAELSAYIDWAPFFQTWDLAGKYPEILDDAVVGEQARRVLADARQLLHKAIAGRWFSANGVVALLPANRVDDDAIEVYADESRDRVVLTWRPLRLQTERPVIEGVRRPNRCLADWIAPKGVAPDHIGLFAVTAGLGADERAAKMAADNDDYGSIMLKALADRLAEAFAERLHQRVRTELWAYAEGESLTVAEMIREQYRGLRPAPGYPACPDHGIKRAMFEVLDAGAIGMGLTDSLAMTPAASVAGFYLAHPDARYFNVGRIGDDQIADFGRAEGLSQDAARRRLALPI